MDKTKYTSIDEYISGFPPEVQSLLTDLRNSIRQAAPEAEEVISYNMPAYKYFGILVYFAAHKGHIGFYPGNAVINEIFKDDIKGYNTSKGTIQFTLDKPIPVKLVKKIVKTRVQQNVEKAAMKKTTKNTKFKS